MQKFFVLVCRFVTNFQHFIKEIAPDIRELVLK
jgi:hypothetical protein